MSQIGSLGDIVFETSADLVRTFGEMTDVVAPRIMNHDVAGAEPVLEWIGPGTRTVDLVVQLNAQLGIDVEAEILRAQEYSQAGALMSFIVGGQPIGGASARWLIQSVEAVRSQYDGEGRAIVADMRLSLAKDSSTRPPAYSATITKLGVSRRLA